MIKELKYLFYILFIIIFIFLTFKYYFSDKNKKNSFRSLNQNNKKILFFSKKLTLLENDTTNIIEFVEQRANKNKKRYIFWELINKDDK